MIIHEISPVDAPVSDWLSGFVGGISIGIAVAALLGC
ncbi:hypothetical protein J2S04_002537 [Alicyclobacillus tengchongensis]|uniref:Uncharacterized protein n=1 Tax=Alicyclobacillus tolerans TaxID=90970 RepID=A0ABT9LZ70_9BACL|nr:hypothetical protein [Alicyclobacillus tengchongensis]